jgi:very-short-patch-repair endonuclease
MTASEVQVWIRLRGKALGVSFRRQHPIGPYILDFACLSIRLAVEIDGVQHEDSVADTVRDAYLVARGWTVLRFSAHQALTNPEAVIETIRAKVTELSPSRQ